MSQTKTDSASGWLTKEFGKALVIGAVAGLGAFLYVAEPGQDMTQAQDMAVYFSGGSMIARLLLRMKEAHRLDEEDYKRQTEKTVAPAPKMQ